MFAGSVYIVPVVIVCAILIIFSVKSVFAVKKARLYRKYLSEPGLFTGREAVTMMMQRAGLEASFYVYRNKRENFFNSDPFEANVYLPDKNAFVMKREILDGKSLLSTAIGCQLAATAISYRNGNLNPNKATDVNGEYALKYILDENELEELKIKAANII